MVNDVVVTNTVFALVVYWRPGIPLLLAFYHLSHLATHYFIGLLERKHKGFVIVKLLWVLCLET